MTDYNKNYHMKCHKSCNKTYSPQFLNNDDKELSLLKDNEYNELDYTNFQNNDFKNHNLFLLQKSIKGSKDECTYNCVGEEVILVNRVFNNIPYLKLEKDYILQLNSFNHVFFIGKNPDIDKEKYYNIMMRYFTISFI